MLQLAVVRFTEGWRIVAGARRWGCFDHRVNAEDAAMRLGAQARAQGRQVRILVQARHGEMRPLDQA